MSAEAIRQTLLSASDVEANLVFRQQADQFEEELLGLAPTPDEYVDLFVEIISHPAFAVQPGAWNFVVRMYTDREKLTAPQLARILEGFKAGYPLYRDERMRLLASDFVARAYEPSQALQAIRTMADRVTDNDAKVPLKVALEVLMRAFPPESTERKICERLYNSLS
jgi:hypothetical protein